MADEPAVSVIIPTYNCGWCIRAAIQSVLEQTSTDFEVLIIDDGSSDDTCERVQAVSDSRIKYLYQENAGRSAARNVGIALAAGRWVAFLDADDLWLPTKLEKQIAAAEHDPDAVMVYCQAYSFSDRDHETAQPSLFASHKVIGSGRPGVSDCLREFLLGIHDVRTSTVIALRSALLSVGGFDTQFTVAEDWDLFMRLAHYGEVLFLQEPLAAYWLGQFESRLDRARRFNSHQMLRQAVVKNLHLANLTETGPASAAHVLAVREWICALTEYGLGNIERARQHSEEALLHQKVFFSNAYAAQVLVEYLMDVLGDHTGESLVQSELRRAISTLTSSSPDSRRLAARSLGYFHARRAFDAYGAGKLRSGMGLAFKAVRSDLTWLRNRGLWTTPIRRLLQESRQGRGSQRYVRVCPLSNIERPQESHSVVAVKKSSRRLGQSDEELAERVS
jgi:GT2 family glycosyltransferase